jgi:hypothetical protein
VWRQCFDEAVDVEDGDSELRMADPSALVDAGDWGVEGEACAGSAVLKNAYGRVTSTWAILLIGVRTCHGP